MLFTKFTDIFTQQFFVKGVNFMILITGDTHGDMTRFGKKAVKKLKKNDSLIICGDFGFIWDGSKAEKKRLKALGKRKYNILFVEGVHENYEELLKYETEEWNGGNTRKISGNLRQLMRGQVFEIDGKKIFSFGGGRSDENDSYLNPSDSAAEIRWKMEIPTENELQEGLDRLAENGNKVDYIVSYEPPAKISEFLNLGKSDRSHVNTYLEQIREKVDFKRWFFGRHHLNKCIPPKFQAVFDSIIDAEEEPKVALTVKK